MGIFVLPEKLDSPLGGCQAKRHNQAKELGEKEGFSTCSKQGEHQGYFPKQCLSGTAKLGKFYDKGACIFMKGLRWCMHIHEGLEQRRIQHRIGAKADRVSALVD